MGCSIHAQWDGEEKRERKAKKERVKGREGLVKQSFWRRSSAGQSEERKVRITKLSLN